MHLKKLLPALQLAIGVAVALTLKLNTAAATQTNLPELEAAISAAESNFTDIVPGAEKSIRWFKSVQQTELAIVYLHGFSASAREISPVTEQLADALGANVFYTRLTGHGRSDDAMATASVDRWLADTRQAYEIGQAIGKRVVVISVSTGGTLAAWLATQPFAKDMLANIMLSPNFGIKSRSGEIVRWPWGFALAKFMSGPYREFTPQSELHKKYWTERYPIEAVVPLVKLVDLVRALDFSQVTTPHLLIYSPNDRVIRVDRVQEFAAKLSSAAVQQVPFLESTDPYQHVLAGDACSASSNSSMLSLIENYLRGN